MLQIVQSCSVGISYHLLFSIYVLVSIRLLAVFLCVLNHLFLTGISPNRSGSGGRLSPWTKCRMAWEQRRAGCDEPQRLKILMVRKTWINMSKVTAEALDLEIERSRFVI